MYCAPAGRRASLASSGRSADRTRGKRKRKSVPSTSNPALVSSSRARGGEMQLRVAIERDAAHHQPGARIPGIVLPETEDAALGQRAMHIGEGVEALAGLDVMKDPVAIRDVELSRRRKVAHGAEPQPRIDVRPARDVEAVARGVDADERSARQAARATQGSCRQCRTRSRARATTVRRGPPAVRPAIAHVPERSTPWARPTATGPD